MPYERIGFLRQRWKKISNIQFAYYEKSDFPDWKESGKDLWGYPLVESEEILEKDEYKELGKYAYLRSLKSIILSGGEIKIGYEANEARDKPVGGIRLKSLVFIDKFDGRNDTIHYSYPRTGISVYDSFSNQVRVSYRTTEDFIEYNRVHPEGHPIINMGNNGFYYPYVMETISGKGSTVYGYHVVTSSSLAVDYPYWLNGLLTEKMILDSKGKMQKLVRYTYELFANKNDRLPQVQPSNFYLDGESLERFYWDQGTSYLSGKDFYKWNIEPRLTPTNTDRFYNLQYGWRVALKEEVEYRYNEDIPYCWTEYCYDNPISLFPTRIVRIGSDGVERTQVFKRPMDMADNVDSVFIKMKEVNLLSPIVKSLNLIDGELINETVYGYQSDGESKAGSIAMTEELIYTADTTEVYVTNPIDTLLFDYGETNYVLEAAHQYKRDKLFRKLVETNGRTDQKSYVYDDFGKLLLECDIIGTTASDKYKGGVIPVDKHVLGDAYQNLRRNQQIFVEVKEDIKGMGDDEAVQFLNSHECFLVSSFTEEILKSQPDWNQAKSYYDCIVRNDYKVFNVFKHDYEKLINRFERPKIAAKYIDALVTFLNYDKRTLFDYLYVTHGEPENVSNGFDYFPKLTPPTGIQNLRLYILDGTDAATGYITHVNGKTPYTVKSISSSKLKVYDIDLSMYTDISSVLAYGQGSYMALVPEGANFKATSYNEDGTVYARFDQSGKVEYYTYDAAGRVIQVTDEYGNILKRYEYNNLNNQ